MSLQIHRSLSLYLSLSLSPLPSPVPCRPSQVIISLESFINETREWVAEFPPLQQPMRFGNKAYRQWHERLQQRIVSYLSQLLSSLNSDTPLLSHLTELSAYLSDSFGNERRIDYGTGHETNLALFFLCLFKLQIVTREDLPALVLRVFVSYLRTMRELQNIYYLEPAGSHGVWGLDDYHCLIYVWGAFQVRQTLTGPSSLHPPCLSSPSSHSLMDSSWVMMRSHRGVFVTNSS
jgi:hypothetical protein